MGNPLGSLWSAIGYIVKDDDGVSVSEGCIEGGLYQDMMKRLSGT